MDANKILYIRKPWNAWEGDEYPFINYLYTSLVNWTAEMVRDFEIPFGYFERALVGHLAVAADRVGYFTLQDYWNINVTPKSKRKSIKRACPDLYISGQGGHPSCLFEVKSMNIGILEPHKLNSLMNRAMSDTWVKLKKYPHEEANYICGLLGMPVYAHVESWDEEGATSGSYYNSCSDIFNDLRNVLEMGHSGNDAPPNLPNFCWGYFLNHKQANEEYEYCFHEMENNHLQERPFAIGMLWAGKIGKTLKPKAK